MAEEILDGAEQLNSINQAALKGITDIKTLQQKLKAKEHEYNKAVSEISVGEKDLDYQRYCYEQRTRISEKATLALSVLDEGKEKEQSQIEAQIEAWERKLEAYQQQVADHIQNLRNKLSCVEKKYDLKRKTAEAESEKSISYYERELSRLNTEKKGTPKTRALLLDIDAILEEIHNLERQTYGVPTTIPSLPELDQKKEKIDKERQEYFEKNPILESGHEKARRELEEQRALRAANPDSYWSSFGQTTIISNTKTKRQPKRATTT